MTREIKFRAWDKQAKRIGQVWEIDIVNEFARYDDENKRYSSQGYDMPIILMQYTGLKDKNGKEIYEGDIWKQGRSIGVIVFEEGQFIIDWRLYRDNWSNLLKFHWDVGQVIGNIYENADLLPEAIDPTAPPSEAEADKEGLN